MFEGSPKPSYRSGNWISMGHINTKTQMEFFYELRNSEDSKKEGHGLPLAVPASTVIGFLEVLLLGCWETRVRDHLCWETGAKWLLTLLDVIVINLLPCFSKKVISYIVTEGRWCL